MNKYNFGTEQEVIMYLKLKEHKLSDVNCTVKVIKEKCISSHGDNFAGVVQPAVVF